MPYVCRWCNLRGTILFRQLVRLRDQPPNRRRLPIVEDATYLDPNRGLQSVTGRVRFIADANLKRHVFRVHLKTDMIRKKDRANGQMLDVTH